ncbi:hypothetical protein P8452_13009 [Trifolium repens]|nr:hypothetical protein P8452_13009 [Trifolium repens]
MQAKADISTDLNTEVVFQHLLQCHHASAASSNKNQQCNGLLGLIKRRKASSPRYSKLGRINQNRLTVEHKTQTKVGLRSSMPRATAVAPFEGVALGVPRDMEISVLFCVYIHVLDSCIETNYSLVSNP